MTTPHNPPPPSVRAAREKAAANMDWTQVVLNGGPPCFHIEDGRFCGRAYRWPGHDPERKIHKFISLEKLLIDTAQNDSLQSSLDEARRECEAVSRGAIKIHQP
jgi:hypothetical protein